MFTANKHWPLESSHQVTLQGVVYQLDVALESLESQRCGIVFIYNMTGSKYQNFDYELSQKILSLLKGAYPARLKKVLIVSAPLWFKAPFKILRLFVREKLRDRVITVGLDQIGLHIPYSALPRELGGNLSLNHKAWLLHCLKSVTNRFEASEDHAVLTPSPEHVVYSHTVASDEAETTENEEDVSVATVALEEVRSSVYEKQNGEEREKEVEVTKDSKVNVTPSRNLINGEASTVVEGASSTPTEEEEEKCLSSASSIPSWDDERESQTGVSLQEFITTLQVKGRKGLYQEYAALKSKEPEGTFETARLKPNQCKNRYTDVLCYDHSRVVLLLRDEDPCSDYINANFVDGYRQKNAFISTQGPLPKTYSDFWRMIWEQQCVTVVMTTRTIERGRGKCGQYWPREDGGTDELDGFRVTNVGVEQKADHIATELLLVHKESGESRQVSHLQFTSWPDYGVPDSAVAMLTFRAAVRERQAQAVTRMGSEWQGHPLGPPIVVHCSAGIGRTGTFITLDICINRLEVTGRVDVHGTVERIRAQRAFSIQMPDQYVFCHLALLEFALLHGLLKDVDLEGFEDDDRPESDSE
uniref:Putative tyrosine-protein phosphatase non-receptor type 9-like isoform x1 n=2 Tax=Ornithodoros turicata TaxID=34597 RepID=A0A2R5L652_9ACAR